MINFELAPAANPSKKWFWFYIANVALAFAVEIFWGLITPSFFSASTSNEIRPWIGFGYLFISFVEIVFMLLAIRHIDAVDPIEENEVK